jgi:hypothetical protein
MRTSGVGKARQRRAMMANEFVERFIQQAELFLLEAQKQTDLDLYLESVTEDKNEQYVMLTISIFYEPRSLLTVEVVLHYPEITNAQTLSVGGKMLLDKIMGVWHD